MAKNRNTFIKRGDENTENSSSTKKSKQKTKKPFAKFTFKKAPAFLRDERFQKAIGLLLILISIYFLIAFTSFVFTGNNDQSILNTPVTELVDGQVIQNWLGKTGAVIAQQFIGDWFGIAAFVFVVLFFLAGFKILFKINLIAPSNVAKYSLFTLLWVPSTLGFLFDSAPYTFLGGGIGSVVDNMLVLLLGEVGTGLLLFFALAAFVIINFDINLNLKPKPTEQPETDSTSPEAHYEAQSALEKDEHFEETKNWVPSVEEEKEAEEKQPEKTEATVEEPESEIDLSNSTSSQKEPQVEKAEDDTNFSFEVTENEEKSVPTEKNNEKAEDESDEPSFEVTEAAEENELKKSELNDKVKEFGEYDPTLDLPKFQLPPVDYLEDHGGGKIKVNREELEANKNKIVDTLRNYKIEIAQIKATIGPTVTLYEIVPEAGVRISKIKNLEDDIALSLSALGIRIIAPIPGKGTIGIEVPNQDPDIVSMRSMMTADKFQNSKMALPVALGKTISNETFVTDLAKMPHLLMAGATGQGKSVGLNVILTSLLYKKHPSQVKFVLVDPKKVELTLFNKIERHYLAKLPDTEEAIITDTKKVINTLNSLCIEMDQRYDLLKDAMVRNIREYNQKFVQRKLNPEKGHRYLPYIVLVIDEFADLIMTAGKEVETPIARLAQLARAIGIHLIVATQRPSVNVITGIIKANFPARIAFRVTSKIDSRTILDAGGADQLIGRGDMLLSLGGDLIRLQCAFVDTPEVEEITDFIGNQQAYPEALLLPEYVGEDGESSPGDIDPKDRDALFEDAARIIVQHQQGSASLLQRRLKLGYNRAGRIVDQLEAAGIIGPFEGSKARQVLIPDEMALEQLLNNE